MGLANERSEDKFLTCLHKLQSSYPKLTDRYTGTEPQTQTSPQSVLALTHKPTGAVDRALESTMRFIIKSKSVSVSLGGFPTGAGLGKRLWSIMPVLKPSPVGRKPG